jgi:dTDP-glucose 4,6-dehydratase
MGSHLVGLFAASGWQVVVLDKLTYAGSRENLTGIPHRFVLGDVCDRQLVERSMDGCDLVIHAAAESHVARSFDTARDFIQTNVEGVRVMLEVASRLGVPRFVHLSTDEVFGSAPVGVAFGIHDRFRPGNPYAASKVAAEALVSAWRHSYDYQAVIVRCTNNYGPRQHLEKAIPSWIASALRGGPVPVHGDGHAIRDWLHVEDFARGILRLTERWEPGSTWHFAGQQAFSNRDMAARVAAMCGGAELQFGPERRGQDDRYALDDARTRARLGWAPQMSLDDGLSALIEWSRQSEDRNQANDGQTRSVGQR